ncbi:MAG: leucine-rich repeat protein [Eubacteriales bacterium]|nr:leucine-rich repeat protein [Eubacteriales bacterium]
MRKWKNILAMCLTGAMLTTGVPMQIFAMEELSAEPAEEYSAPEVREEGLLLDAEETGEGSFETSNLIETPEGGTGSSDLTETIEEDLLLSDGEDQENLETDELSAGEEAGELVMEGEDTISGISNTGTEWTYTKSTGLLVLTRGKTEEAYFAEFSMPSIPDIQRDEIKHIRLYGFEEINSDSFYSMSNLRSFYMDDNVTRIGHAAFAYCNRLESVRLSENLQTLDFTVFDNCLKLQRITIPSGVEEIGAHVFTDCISFKEITILSRDCEIADSAIGRMENQNNGVFNKDITVYCYPGSTVEKYAKEKGFRISLIEGDHYSGTCGENLQWEVNRENKRLSIWGSGEMTEYIEVSPPWAYLHENIQEIVISSGVTSITEMAFYNQYNVTKVSIPESVTTIGAQAFLGCTSLKEVSIPNENAVIGENAVGYQTNYSTNKPEKISGFVLYGYRGSTAQAYAKARGITFKALNDQEVVEGNCGYYLEWRYTKKTGLLEIFGQGHIPDYSNSADNLPPWTEIVGAENIKAISFAKTVTTVGEYAFYGLKNVKTVTMPEWMGMVRAHGFEGCTSLTTVKFNDYLYEIEAYGFAGCTSLTNVNLPDEVTDLGEYAFAGCSAMTDLVIRNVRFIPIGCFMNCSSLKNITWSKVTDINNYGFSGCTSLEQITLPINMEAVGAYAFYNCPALKTITDNCRREPVNRDYMTHYSGGYFIGEKAFGYLASKEKVSGLTIRGYERSATVAYAREHGFNYEIIPYPVSGSCGTNATWNYDAATKTLTIQGTGAIKDWVSVFNKEDEYTLIPNDWFGWNFEAEKIVVEEGITVIGICTFMMMENVKEISLPNSLREIRSGSFSGFNALDALWLPREIQTISESTFFYHFPNTIYGYTGTESERFANEWNIKFVDRTACDALEQEIIRVTKTQMGPGYISITWNASEYATSYRIYRRIDSGATKLVKTVNSTVRTYRDTDVEVGKTYRYMVVGALGDARSQKETKSLKYIQIPKVSAAPGKNGMMISWEKNSSAAGYRLYCKDEATGVTTKIATANASTASYKHEPLTSGKKYTYTIQAYKGSDVVVYESATELFLKETALTVSNGMTGVNLKWSKVTGASGFNIYRKTSSTSYTKLTNVGKDVVQYIDTSAVSGTTYTYSVVAYSGKTKSNYQNKSILCVKGTTLSLSNGTQGVQAKWTKVPGVSGYYLYRKTSSGSYAKIATLGASATSYVDKTASSGVSYYYAVRPYSGSTQGAYEQKPIRCLAAPTVTAARTNKVNTVKLTWTKVTGAKGYYIYRKTGTEGFTKIGSVIGESTLSYVDSKASSSKSFTYAVRAYNGNTQSGYKAVTVK